MANTIRNIVQKIRKPSNLQFVVDGEFRASNISVLLDIGDKTAPQNLNLRKPDITHLQETRRPFEKKRKETVDATVPLVRPKQIDWRRRQEDG
jgi:hypothetical protein